MKIRQMVRMFAEQATRYLKDPLSRKTANTIRILTRVTVNCWTPKKFRNNVALLHFNSPTPGTLPNAT